MAHKIDIVELGWDDLAGLLRSAESLMTDGKYIQAFSIGRLLDPEVIKSDLIRFPAPEDSLAPRLLSGVPQDEESFTRMVKFCLRACYISHNHWQDIFVALCRLMEKNPQRYHRKLVLELIEQDAVFCCNLLHQTIEALQGWDSSKRRQAIEAALAQKHSRL